MAILRHLIGRTGRVTAIEFDPGLMARLERNFANARNVRVVQGDGTRVAAHLCRCRRNAAGRPVAGTSWMLQGTLQPAHALLAAIAGSVSRSRTSFSASPIFALISSCGNIWRAHRVWNERVSRKGA
jgi:precorrin-6B methylase 2